MKSGTFAWKGITKPRTNSVTANSKINVPQKNADNLSPCRRSLSNSRAANNIGIVTRGATSTGLHRDSGVRSATATKAASSNPLVIPGQTKRGFRPRKAQAPAKSIRQDTAMQPVGITRLTHGSGVQSRVE